MESRIYNDAYRPNMPHPHTDGVGMELFLEHVPLQKLQMRVTQIFDFFCHQIETSWNTSTNFISYSFDVLLLNPKDNMRMAASTVLKLISSDVMDDTPQQTAPRSQNEILHELVQPTTKLNKTFHKSVLPTCRCFEALEN
jgi:hypothetical protein